MTDAGPIVYEFRWTPELYGEIAGRRPPPALGLTGSTRSMAGATAAALAVIVGLTALPALAYGADALLAALWGAASALLAVLLVLVPYLRRTRVAADLATRARQGPVRVTLSADGVQSETELAHSRTRWQGVALISETPGAVLLWLGAAFALPLPDAALPDGLDRAAALARIRAWREAGR